MRMQRHLFIADSYKWGTGRFVRNCSHEMRRRGIDVDTLKLDGFDRGFSLSAFVRFCRRVRTRNFRMYHAVWTVGEPAACVWRLYSSMAAPEAFHGAVMRHPPDMEAPMLQKLLRRRLSRKAVVLARGNDACMQWKGPAGGNLFQIPEPLRTEPKILESRRSFLASQDLPEDARYLLYLGRFHPEKSPMTALRVFGKLRRERQDEDLHLVFVGEGPQEKDLLWSADWMHCRNRVLFRKTASATTAHNWMAHAECVLCPGRDGGTVPYEALGQGTPVCVCESAESKVALDALCGVLPGPVPRYDPDAMGLAVAEVLKLKAEGKLDRKVLAAAVAGNDAATCVDRMLAVAEACVRR